MWPSKDLSELLEERNAPFETGQVLEWADQILDALEDLHSQDIVHRDIKPSNLKLTPRGRIKLLDFGIAKGAAGDMTGVGGGTARTAFCASSGLTLAGASAGFRGLGRGRSLPLRVPSTEFRR